MHTHTYLSLWQHLDQRDDQLNLGAIVISNPHPCFGYLAPVNGSRSIICNSCQSRTVVKNAIDWTMLAYESMAPDKYFAGFVHLVLAVCLDWYLVERCSHPCTKKILDATNFFFLVGNPSCVSVLCICTRDKGLAKYSKVVHLQLNRRVACSVSNAIRILVGGS